MDDLLLAINNESSFLFDLSGQKVQNLLINGINIDPNLPQFELSRFHSGLIKIKEKNGKVNYYSVELRKQVLQGFSEIYSLQTFTSDNNQIDSIYAGKFGDKWAVSDLHNSYVLPYKPMIRYGDFIVFQDFKTHYETDCYGICDLDGNVILKPKSQIISYIGCDMFYVQENGLVGFCDDYYVDSSAEIIRPVFFDKVFKKISENEFIVFKDDLIIVDSLQKNYKVLGFCDEIY